MGLHGNAIDFLNVPPVRIQHLHQGHTTQGGNLSCHVNHLPWLRELVAVRRGRFGELGRQEVRCIRLEKESVKGNALCHLVHGLRVGIGDHSCQAYLAAREELQPGLGFLPQA